ncbi:hypothetical protein [Streptomyces sp. NPDC002122]|uniref:DUF7919 family protein n=1 Tax=Streptomyces sp. NPDC002122 TaxID=3154407 RepID=UPI00332A929A
MLKENVMEFPDLSEYEFSGSALPMLNVGWLGTETGVQGEGEPPVEADFLARLRVASRLTTRLALGFHECEFCDGAARGNGEYAYYCSDGSIYCAPVMILHYVEEHGYRPPMQFRKSLLGTVDLAWDERADFLSNFILDDSADFILRCEAVSDIANWIDARSLDVLRIAARDEELVDIAAEDIGVSMGWVSLHLGITLGDLPVGDLNARIQASIIDTYHKFSGA